MRRAGQGDRHGSERMGKDNKEEGNGVRKDEEVEGNEEVKLEKETVIKNIYMYIYTRAKK